MFAVVSLAWAADAPVSPPSSPLDPELEEILVQGLKPIRKPKVVQAFLPRLAGRFVVDGHVDLHGVNGPADVLEVQGRADCVALFPAQAVHCELKIRWPDTIAPGGEPLLGGISTLYPASLLYGYDPERVALRHMLVDSKGIANSALGYLLTDDMLVSRSPCAGVPGHCERVVRVTAKQDLKQVEMKIDMEVEFRKAASFMFVMHRVPGTPDGTGGDTK
jgi:hypothetical protein